MKKLTGGFLGTLFDTRVVISICGLVLSVIMHEVFHIIMHWHEIASIALFPSPSAIVEITFTPTHTYDLIAEEALAYIITIITLVATAMLVHDINDQRDTRSVEQIIMTKEYSRLSTETDKIRALRQLSLALGLTTTRRQQDISHPFDSA